MRRLLALSLSLSRSLSRSLAVSLSQRQRERERHVYIYICVYRRRCTPWDWSAEVHDWELVFNIGWSQRPMFLICRISTYSVLAAKASQLPLMAMTSLTSSQQLWGPRHATIFMVLMWSISTSFGPSSSATLQSWLSWSARPEDTDSSDVRYRAQSLGFRV